MERIKEVLSENANIVEIPTDPFQLEEYKKRQQKLLESYKDWVLALRIKMEKRQYRKVIGEVVSRIDGYRELTTDVWECQVIEAGCILKLIERKFRKYPNEIKKVPSRQNQSVQFWFNQIFLILEVLVLNFRPELNPDIDLKDEKTLNKIELVVQVHLDLIYHLAIFSKVTNQIAQMAAYFGIVDNIKIFLPYSRNPKTLNVYQKLLLLRSSISIANNDFINAINFQKNSIDICFREFFLMVDYDEGLNPEKISSKPAIRKKLYDNFINIVVVFYLRGVCFESLGNLSKAIEAYKQSRWFSLKFLIKDVPELAVLSQRIEKRVRIYQDIIGRLKTAVKRIKKARFKKLQQLKERVENRNYTQKGNEELLKKIANGERITNNEVLEKALSKIRFTRITEIDNESLTKKDENMRDYPKTQFIMSTVKLINKLLSNKFSDVVKNMKNLEINNLDEDAIESIKRKTLEKPSKDNSIDLSFIHQTMNIGDSIRTPTAKTSFFKTSRCTTGRKGTNFSRSSLGVPSLRYQPDQVEKINYDEENFSRDYLKRKLYLEKFAKKEMDFLAEVLRAKRAEIRKDPIVFDEKKLNKEVENEFAVKLSIARTQDKRTAIQKLINKQGYDALTEIKKKETSTISEPSFIETYHKKKKLMPDLNNKTVVSQINEEMMKKLNMECETLNTKDKKLKKYRAQTMKRPRGKSAINSSKISKGTYL